MKLCTIVFLLLSAFYVEAQSSSKPNIIVILTDDMGFGDLSCLNKIYHTPNIDRLASQGRIFTKYYSASPICSPSRVGLMTGMAPAKWNITSFLQKKEGNKHCEQADFLTTDAPSLARSLKSAGYMTGHFGKWHMGGGRDVDDAPAITAYGFDEYNSTWESPDPDPMLTATDWIWSDKDSIKRWNRTGYFVDRALDFLKKNNGKPCYLNLWPDDVHTPWVSGDDISGRSAGGPEAENSFESVLEVFDRQIGRLIDGIRRLGLEENTIIVFTSDNGPLPTFNGRRSAGMRGSKLSLYEAGIRMPFIIKWPDRIPPASIDSITVLSATDLFNTFCKIAGAEPNTVSDGQDMSQALVSKPIADRKALYWEYGRNETSFKYPDGHDRSPSLAIREGRWKLLMNSDGSHMELYDIDQVFNESNNLVQTNTVTAKRLSKKLLKWWNGLPGTAN